MTEALVPAVAEPAVVIAGGGEIVLPQVIVDAGPAAVARFLEFFAGRIAERADAGGVRAGGFTGRTWLTTSQSPSMRIAARCCFTVGTDPWVRPDVGGHVERRDVAQLETSRLTPRRGRPGPKHVVTKGATPGSLAVGSPEAPRDDRHRHPGRTSDRALLSVMLYSFARVSAVLGMRRQDYFGQGSRGG